jgi:hypothetical protein
VVQKKKKLGSFNMDPPAVLRRLREKGDGYQKMGITVRRLSLP